MWALALSPDLPLAQIYVPNGPGGYTEYRTGSEMPAARKPAAFPRVGALIDVARTGSEPIYVHLHLDPGEPLQVELAPARAVADSALLARLILGLFFGVVLAVGAANIYMAVVMRDRGAALFAVYIVSIAAYVLGVSGIGDAYLWPNGTLNAWVAAFLNAASFVAFLVFIRTFLSTRATSKLLDGLLIAVFSTVVVLAFPLWTWPALGMVSLGSLIAGMALTIVAASIRARHDFPARIFLVGFVPVAIGQFTDQIVAGWTIQILILSLGVVERMRLLALDKQRTEQRNAELQTLAYFDPLTGALNRIAFDERLKTTVTRAQRFQEVFAILFVDLDGFKDVNDSFGHQTGDEVLRIVARRLKGSIRESDELARFGGDEFAIIAHTSPEGSLILREKVANILVTPLAVGGKNIDIGVSVGVALFPHDAATPDDLLAAADRAMYEMKQAHKRRRLRSIS